MYVDENAALVLVLLTGDDAMSSSYHVHGVAASEPWMASCVLTKDEAQLHKMSGELISTGTRKSSGEIVWDNSSTWRPLQYSSPQFAFLTNRPYVPMTYVVVAMFCNMMHRTKRIWSSIEIL